MCAAAAAAAFAAAAAVAVVAAVAQPPSQPPWLTTEWECYLLVRGQLDRPDMTPVFCVACAPEHLQKCWRLCSRGTHFQPAIPLATGSTSLPPGGTNQFGSSKTQCLPCATSMASVV